MSKITVAYGDGIGPEIMEATLSILKSAGAELEYDVIEIGEKVYKAGNTTGIAPESWDSLRTNKVFLKAPITTPQGGGYKSLNVTVRKTLGLYANLRPVRSYHPVVPTKHPVMDMFIVRENEEDLYAGIEHRQTDEVYQCLKLITRPGSERIMRYAFEFAKANGRKKVTCFSKDNIMKMTDGLFHKIYDEVAAEYPDIEKEHQIIDIGTARLADTPENFDVLVLQNLYGDILSDVAAQIAGSVGLCGSSNFGDQCAMFEAIHGSAPDIAGKNIANPSGLLQGALLMLTHLGQFEVARKIDNAWLKTLEDGIHTGDIYSDEHSKEKVGTTDFAKAVVDNLGNEPTQFKKSQIGVGGETKEIKISVKRPTPAKKEFQGVDVFVHKANCAPGDLAAELNKACQDTEFELEMITNRGVKVWPDGFEETFCTDHWRCRFKAGNKGRHNVGQLLLNLDKETVDAIKTENLYSFDGERGYSLGQGQ